MSRFSDQVHTSTKRSFSKFVTNLERFSSGLIFVVYTRVDESETGRSEQGLLGLRIAISNRTLQVSLLTTIKTNERIRVFEHKSYAQTRQGKTNYWGTT